MNDLEADLAAVLNRHSRENASDTPDYILSQFMLGCLAAFNTATQQRETCHGRDPRPTQPKGGDLIFPEATFPAKKRRGL